MKVSDVVYDWSYGESPNPLHVATEKFVHVVGISLSEGYDWDDLQAWFNPENRMYYWLSSSGCSCNSLGDSVSKLDDFEVGHREDLMSAVRRKYDASYSSRTGMATALLDDMATVRDFPEPSPMHDGTDS